MATKKRTQLVKDYTLTLGAGVAPDNAQAYDTVRRQETPTDITSIFKRIRKMGEDSDFLSSYLKAKIAVYDYGFSITRGPQATAKEDAVQEWLAKEITTEAEYTDTKTGEKLTVELHLTNAEAVRKFKDDVMREFFLLTNCVAMWLDDGPLPITLDPELCTYTETLGIPVLYYRHGLSVEQQKLLPDEQKTRFAKNSEIMLNPEHGEHYRVLKRGRVGSGFVKPEIFPILTTLGEVESKQAGYHALAYLTRGATRHHKLGHEIKQGNHAGKPHHFWNKKRGDAVIKDFKGRQGPHEFTSNFDHAIDYPWPAPEVFDEVAWKGTNLRLRNWGGPVAQMMIGEKLAEGGLNLLRAEATKDRQLIADFILPVVKAVFSPPDDADIQLTWSDLIFNDAKQAVDLVKFSVQQGLASVSTARKWIGLRSEEEDANKLREADDPDNVKKYLPMFDMSHGTTPATGMLNDPTAGSEGAVGADPGKRNGRPPGGGTSGTGSD